jgi:putative membrane protein
MRWTENDRERIKHAVGMAEAKGRGEIAVAVANSSSDYSLFEWPLAVGVALLWSIILLTVQNPVCAWIQNHWWIDPTRLFVLFTVFSTFLLMAVVYALTNLPIVDRMIIPRKVMAAKVHDNALKHFMSCGVMNTRERTGILLFVSLLERRVEIVVDRGINEKIEPGTWDAILNRLIASIKTKQPTDGLCSAINECGDLLAIHFPATDDNPDELTNEPILPGGKA